MTKHKILIVDDQQSNLALLKSQLEDYDVIEADDGRLALRKVVEENPDIIVLDVLMPGVDGYSVLSILKNSNKTRLIPVILITALSGTDEKVKSLEKGADDFIIKPCDPAELRARVKNLLRVKEMRDELQNVHNMLVSVVTAVEAKYSHLSNHSRRTSFYAEKLAQKVFSTGYDREQIKLAGLLHDIGKIAVKESIFLEPNELEAEKLESVKSHPVVGERICSSISALKPILPYIRHHHEHFDGSGYPDGLTGKGIPLGARILAVADAFDAMTSDRPYREAFSQQQAVEILVSGSGKQWDPRLVTLFCGIVQEDKSALSELALRDFEQQYMFK